MLDNLSTLESTDANENLNHMIVRKAPKALTFSESESLDFRVSAAVAQKNEGHQYVVQVFYPFYTVRLVFSRRFTSKSVRINIAKVLV